MIDGEGRFFKEVIRSGANGEIRTPDLTLTKGALYQLSYISILTFYMERVTGIEPVSLAWKARVIASIRHPRVYQLS